MTLIDIQDAGSQLPRLVHQAAGGEEVVLSEHGRPVARLIPVADVAGPRVPGGWNGRVRIAPDFDASDAEIERSFEDSQIFPGT